MNFITLDFETASQGFHDPCEIGITVVENDVVVKSEAWLIKPKCYPNFDFFCSLVSGIHPPHVANAPEFPELWKKFESFFENALVVCHHASFDIGVLRNTLLSYNLPLPTIRIACSYQIAKCAWPSLISYNLDDLCKNFSIHLVPHAAESDSLACALLTLKAFKENNIDSADDLKENLKIRTGELSPDIYKACKRVKEYVPQRKIEGDVSKHKPEHDFYGKTVVFTGVLMSMKRNSAQQLVADIGAVVGDGVNKTTNFLVVGHQDKKLVGEDGLSGKQEKAAALLAKGVDIEILTESEFLKIVEM